MPAKGTTLRDHFWIKNRKGERFQCDTRFWATEDWSVDPGKSAGELLFEWLRYVPLLLSLSYTGR